MGIDLTKLSPAPWFVLGGGVGCGIFQGTRDNRGYPIDLDDPTLADAEFIALARNAFAVMLRRGWYPICDSEKWFVAGEGTGILYSRRGDGGVEIMDQPVWTDPFTAIVEADNWYRENVEKEK